MILILNASGVKGLSWKFVDALENKGFFVTKIASHSEIIKDTQIFYGNESSCFKKIANFDFLFPKNTKIEINDELIDKNRCQILIILGADLKND